MRGRTMWVRDRFTNERASQWPRSRTRTCVRIVRPAAGHRSRRPDAQLELMAHVRGTCKSRLSSMEKQASKSARIVWSIEFTTSMPCMIDYYLLHSFFHAFPFTFPCVVSIARQRPPVYSFYARTSYTIDHRSCITDETRPAFSFHCFLWLRRRSTYL